MLLKQVWPFLIFGLSLTLEKPKKRFTTSAYNWVDFKYNGFLKHLQSKGLEEQEEQDLAIVTDFIQQLCIQK